MISEKLKSTTKQNESVDLGFGTKTNQQKRLLNHDGSFNLKRKGQKFVDGFSLYHWLITISWRRFIFVVLSFFFVINLIYALIYYLLGVDTHLLGTITESELDKFVEAYFFSSQTITTVGYGRISPVGFFSNFLASLEALTGLLSFSIVTGILYGRFSKPKAKVIYSDNALIAPYKNINGLMFRIVNGYSVQLIEVEVQVIMSYRINTNSTDNKRTYVQLKLERNKINFFPITWTIVHPIDSESPLEDLTLLDLEETDAEFLIIIKAFDDTFSQTVYSRNSYKYNELIYGAKFSPNFETEESGATVLYIDRINKYHPAELNPKIH